jgi:hypothetical protein
MIGINISCFICKGLPLVEKVKAGKHLLFDH